MVWIVAVVNVFWAEFIDLSGKNVKEEIQHY
jgi:hypothetical protein